MGAGEEEDTLPPPLLLDLRDLTAVAVLGRGAKGIVFLVRIGERDLALKAISRSGVQSNCKGGSAYRRISLERDILSQLRHPLLPALRGLLSTDEIVGFAIDPCRGGDLNSLRKKQTESMFSEDIIRFYAAELVLALEHLHGLGIVYRDLKPENVLIQDNGHIMLVDFDLSTRLPLRASPSPSPPPTPRNLIQKPQQPPRQHRRRLGNHCFSCYSPISSTDESESPRTGLPSPPTASSSSPSQLSSSGKSNSFVGTEEYVAPEVIKGTGHDFAVDWWSLGVVLYEMLYGRTPFRGQNRKETFHGIVSKEPDLVGERTPLRSLIRELLEKDPAKRIGSGEIKGHEFFMGVHWESVMAIPRPPFIPADEEAGRRGEDGMIDVVKYVLGASKNSGGSAAGDVVVVDKEDEKERNVAAEVGDGKRGSWLDRLSNRCPSPDFFVF